LLLAFVVLAAGCVDAPPATSPFGTAIASVQQGFQLTVDPPVGGIQRGVNALTVHVADAQGTPAVLTHVLATMPVHGHSATPSAIAPREAGTYEVEGLDLMMAGDWQIRFSIAPTGESENGDEAIFDVEVP
jgi:hypothetical protein